MLLVSLTNQTGRPLYIRGSFTKALVGTQWIQFKNADGSALEPHAFDVMKSEGEKRFMRPDQLFPKTGTAAP